MAVITNPSYMKDDFELKIETIHLPDRGTSLNAHKLPSELLKKRELVSIDIGDNTPVSGSDYSKKTDPTLFYCEKNGRGGLKSKWQESVEPVMCAYKLVSANFKWLGLQTKVESYIQTMEERIFRNFHRELVCSMDEWIHLDMNKIRDLEAKTQSELNENRNTGEVRGTKSE